LGSRNNAATLGSALAAASCAKAACHVGKVDAALACSNAARA